MALTPDDVVTKQFQHVRFKEGFDPDEVDDFLDEIVVEWRKTIAENDELKAKLAAYEAGEPVVAPVAALSEPVVEEVAEVVVEDEPEAETPVVEAEPASFADAPAPAAASAGIIELAQRLHDEHVAEGKSQRDKLISEAEARAAAIISDAETQGREEIARNEAVRTSLESERVALESKISELRQFERDYRGQLRTFIEEKLRDLDITGTSSVPTSGF